MSGDSGAGAAGRNLPRFTEVQLEFAQHIRNPDVYPAPEGIEPRRMRVYVELFYSSIETFLNNTFPVARELSGEARWGELVRAFIHRHSSASPYFLDIPQEFMEFVTAEHAPDGLPDFFAELIHYEWVELALDVLDECWPEDGIDGDGDLAEGAPVVSPLAWSLAYRYPVHTISPDYQPHLAPPEPTYLIVYRDRHERVRFFESSAVTARLLEVLADNRPGMEPGAGTSGRAAVRQVVAEAHLADADAAERFGLTTLERLRDADIIVGTGSRPSRSTREGGET